MNFAKLIKKYKKNKKTIKPWGAEFLIEVNNRYVVKILLMKKGSKCSLQYHKKKHETVFVLKGIMYLHVKNKILKLNKGDYYVLKPFLVHRMEAKNNDCLYLECSTPELRDIIRISDDYGRK
jgi:mannose-6-phosphate isomerase-like protein (cupin superfamily)